MQWDVFCRVIDNYGDIGVSWRLAADLAGRGQSVRLWVDDPSALAWMAPAGAAGIHVRDWPDTPRPFEPGDVVIETFGCDLPGHVVQAMAGQSLPPVWINLEYLSAESYVERSHRLRSPQLSGPGRGLDKWFYYPGFNASTGSLLREPGLIEAQARFDSASWLSQTLGVTRHPGERLISLFCYPRTGALEMLPALLPPGPVKLLVTAGLPVPKGLAPEVDVHCLPYLTQADYDRLLRSCDLNFVRGEDSFVRAQWAARPFIWQIYPQSDTAHAAKLQAFLDAFLRDAPATVAAPLRHLWTTWNGLHAGPAPLPAHRAWQAHCEKWSARLQTLPDLVSGLFEFVEETR